MQHCCRGTLFSRTKNCTDIARSSPLDRSRQQNSFKASINYFFTEPHQTSFDRRFLSLQQQTAQHHMNMRYRRLSRSKLWLGVPWFELEVSHVGFPRWVWRMTSSAVQDGSNCKAKFVKKAQTLTTGPLLALMAGFVQALARRHSCLCCTRSCPRTGAAYVQR